MATMQQVDTILAAIRRADPYWAAQRMNDGRSGYQAVLKLLSTSDTPVTAGMIAQYMGVSTARVAVLLKKMNCKGLVEKHRDPQDARITIVTLTEKGKALSLQIYEHLRDQTAQLIDQIGMDDLTHFLDTLDKIKVCLNSQHSTY